MQETREAVHEHADTAPREYREEEQALLNEQEGALASEETTAVREMEQSRERSQREIEAEQQTAMTVEERRRQEVSDHIEGIYTRTRRVVERRLEGLNRKVESRFTEGERRARERFEEFVDREMNIWKFRRYMVSGTGAFTLIADLFRDINEFPEVEQIYEDGKNQYIAELDAVIVDIANLVETTLARCQDEIQQGRDDVQEYVEEGLPEALREVGEQTSDRISERYDELRASVEERRNTLADQLVERYQQARQALDQRIEEMQAENRGLVNSFVEGLQAVLEVLRNLRERLASILGEASGAIECVLNDPPGFVGNLIGAVGRGFRQFAGNILPHLRRGLMGWLFGTLASAGIEIPSEFSLRAIIGLILQILGITRDRLRTKVVRIVGERNVAVVERVWGVVSTLVREGPQGLWDEIRQGVGNLKEMVIEGIKQWVVTRIVMAAVNRIVTMWNPAGAIVQAVLAIYNTLMFFWERRDQILDLVQSIVRSVDSICRGALAQAANLVERTMGLTLPVIISFFARLLGLGGIAAAIQGIIRRPRRRVDRSIDRALRRIARRLGIRGRGRRAARGRRAPDTRRYRQLADRAAAELSRVTGPPQSPDVLRREKRQQARQLQRTYSSRLGRGARMRIQIARARRGQEERGIGFTIAVRPGSVRKRGTISAGEGSSEIRSEAGRAVASQLNRGIRNASQVRQVYQNVFRSLRSRGLKYLGVSEVPRRPGLFKIHVGASNTTEEGQFDYEEPNETLQFNIENFKEFVKGYGTQAIIWLNERIYQKRGDNGKWFSKGNMHVEELLFAQVVESRRPDEFSGKTFTIAITRSPCPLCQGRLERLAKNYKVQIILRPMTFYTGRGKYKVIEENLLKWYEDNRDKIKMLPLSLEDAIADGLTSVGIDELPRYIRNHFKRYFTELNDILNQTKNTREGGQN